MNPEAMRPFGLALLDYYKGNLSATLAVYRDDGYRSELPLDIFYRESTSMNIDRIALDNCRGRVLDIGAGTGLHSLYLQNQGLPVCAIDISPEACNVMRAQGLNEVHCLDISDFQKETFDTILILGRSIGMVENMAGLDYFLKDIHRLMNQDGQILLDSLNVTCTSNPLHLAYQEANQRAERYIGETRLYFEYKGIKGPVCGWLHVDPVKLANHASETGWSCEILLQEKDGNYLAKLTKAN